ncbi:hypothetical protein ES705_24043 [subsurface metagenome]
MTIITEDTDICLNCSDEIVKMPYGLYGICNESNYIPLVKLKNYKQEEYLCVKTPYRDYIKNKYAQFKLYLPIKTITDNEAIIWIIKNILKNEGEKTIEELVKRIKLSNIEQTMKELTVNKFIFFNQNTKKYSHKSQSEL